MKEIFVKTITSPVGYLILESTRSAICAIRFSDKPGNDSVNSPEILIETEKQLTEYFYGKRFHFDLELEPEGSEFCKKVWKNVCLIPFGKTTTYNEIAIKLGSPTYNRAIGLANGKNPIPIIIPCHRVIGTNGKLIGYAGGIERKKKLLLHEMAHSVNGRLF
jgi:methylated-DNA-[protein]-cysteine S-methyltransferase